MSVLDIRDLKVEFPGRKSTFVAVQGVHLEVEAGKILGVVGESGAGKSTVGNAVIGLLQEPGRIAQGEIRLHDDRIDTLPEKQKRHIRGRKIGMIFQDPLTSLDPLQTVESQLVETIRTHLPLSSSQARARAIELIDAVGIPNPSERISQYPHQFSGGMRQRVVIALALCAEPELVIADEPTTALDVSIQAQILELMKRLCADRNVAMMVITHDMGVIADITDHVAVMYHGKLVEYGETHQVLGAPQHRYTQSLISAVPRPDVRVERFPVVDYIEKAGKPAKQIDIATHWLGQTRDYTKTDGPLVEIEDLTMRFEVKGSLIPSRRKHFDAVKAVSFDIKEGETFGVVGESGSGKSTIARIITGLYHPTAGTIRFAGTDLTSLTNRRQILAMRRQMQMIFQDPYSSLNARMRVRDIIAEPIKFHRLASSNSEVRQIVEDLLDHVGLGAAAGKKFPHEFSGGQRQRISIARALATRPRFLLCDEPTSALDVSIQAQILNLLKDLQDELGLTMMFISHDLAVIRQMCNRIAVMKNGELCEVADCDTLFESPQHDYTRHLLKLMPSMELLSRANIETA
ncbi:peptide/nickel transport system ATP-binding protein [Roseibium hamelinense]|uniref:Peptide/nickel transport system ATP-binding protein n=1 Tax=Roseibium hamelinense TaxID=150831 RepID=A0A562SQ77_9HYPH|nr:ABC transporter ATP-binding protein [Roseibium hamelinense]MTI44290.1 ABC transporter ATP-binding protein [Roseibium hamelinense]TWI82936.1 peptide/nickel transport system ATP-binding protein [Roseibium hamelinense]